MSRRSREGFGFRVQGLGFRVWGLGFRVQGLEFRRERERERERERDRERDRERVIERIVCMWWFRKLHLADPLSVFGASSLPESQPLLETPEPQTPNPKP